MKLYLAVSYHIQGTVRQNELETGREALYPLRMTKHAPFRYVKTSPGIIHLAVILPPLWLIIPAIFATRRHACASLQTGLLWHGVARLFAC